MKTVTKFPALTKNQENLAVEVVFNVVSDRFKRNDRDELLGLSRLAVSNLQDSLKIARTAEAVRQRIGARKR